VNAFFARSALFLGVWALVAGAGLNAHAHKVSDSYLRVRLEGTALTGQWLLALHDLEVAIGLDRNEDGAITWGELKQSSRQLLDYAAAHLALECDGDSVLLRFEPELRVDQLANGGYAVLTFSADPGRPPESVLVEYRAFFEENPLHRGLLLLECGGNAQQSVFNPVETRLRFECARPQPLREFRRFVAEGVWHIWIGYDHILFLLTLLLPSVLRREEGQWIPVEGMGGAFLNVFKIVTAFTLAHSVTLTLAALEWVKLPSRMVESIIAASIVVAALNNLWPVITGRTWLIAFGFGLIHGFGFASVLADLGLPRGSLVRALVGFNLGVEVGQLAIVTAFLPVAWFLRRFAVYRRWVLYGGSCAVAMLATWWMIERLLWG
jgi:hypothetical protein